MSFKNTYVLLLVLTIFPNIIQAKQYTEQEVMNAIQVANKNKKPALQFAIGYLYESGNGVKTNYSEAHRWYSLAAEQGNTSAMTRLGRLSVEGLGVNKDPSKAFYWYEKASQLGDKSAQNILGLMYQDGNLIDGDYQMAAYWFKKAANQGSVSAQYSLGNLYFTGRGVADDYSQARFWFEKVIRAQQGGDNDSKERAYYRLGQIFEDGLDVSKDGPKAKDFYMAAAKLGHDEAKVKIGDGYNQGKWGLPRDREKALHWYHKAGASGEFSAGLLKAELKHQKWCKHVSGLPNEQWSVNDARYFERTCLK
ncbi:tetratricopeptide repeat protein [Neptuniibacter halophilus]|uniref:tetratricopeptide repeat protein n=1 Tax=Neptuniibacter halophilus TaxID=651666 RepID=UPI0025744902|nr:tetratricopeptide repeat protein [Neptuniibacter halophilus]